MKFIAVLPVMLLCAAPGAGQIAGSAHPDPHKAFVPAKLDSHADAIVAGMNRFGFELYGKLRGQPGNAAVSPASVSTAFGLAYAGARETTATEIASVLHYPSVRDFHASFGRLLRSMELHQNGRTLTINNALWLQQGLKVRPDYLALVSRSYGAGLQRVDYRGNADAARQTINGWVESKTNNRIRGLLGPLDVTKHTRSVLVNTVYFKADWADPFNKEATKSKAFTLESGNKVSKPLMNRQLEVPFAEQDGVKAVALPYRGGETEMVVLLPAKAGELERLESSLTAATFDEWLAKLAGRTATVDVTIPKFKMASRFELNGPLMELGMRTPFSNDSDFSGLKVVNAASNDEEDWNLKIDKVVHQAFVEVEEKGTEAAAATAIAAITITGVIMKHPETFRADHPFLFVIRDRRTRAILFIGRYAGEPE